MGLMQVLFGAGTGLFGTQGQQQSKFNTIRIQTSCYGVVVGLVFGTARITGNLIWIGDNRIIPVESGGKGGPGSGVTGQAVYKVSFEMGLCEGPISGIGMSWQSKKLYKEPHPKLTIFNGTYPQAPWDYMTTKHASQALGYPGLAKVAAENISLGSTNALPDWSFEVKGFNILTSLTSTFVETVNIPEKKPYTIVVANRTAFVSDGGVVFAVGGAALTYTAGTPGDNQYTYADGVYTFNKADKDLAVIITYDATVQDANPADIVSGIVTNTKWGLGLAAGIIDVEDWYDYCMAATLFLSPEFTSQSTVAEVISSILECTNTEVILHDGAVLKFIPYGDTELTANGVTWTPNVTPLYNLTDDGFLGDSDEDPVRTSRTTPADAWNSLQVEFINRAMEYNHQTYEALDQAAIDLYGRRPADQKSLLHIKEVAIAQYVARLLLQRQLYVRNTYRFTVGWRYCLLEPMDIVTLTDSGLGMSLFPVRIVSMEENENGEWDIEAEDCPQGAGHAALYDTESGRGKIVDYNADPGNVNTPVIFSAPGILTPMGYEVWIAVTGDTEVWGGTDVYLSTDGATYVWIGRITTRARYGVLTDDFLTGSDPDTTNTCKVDLTQSEGELLSGTADDADDHLTLCLVEGTELISYQTATLTATNKYTLGTRIRRGIYGTAIATHNTGSSFVRVDEGVFKYQVPQELIGKEVNFKFCSFNQYTGEAQDIADVTAYPYTLTAGLVLPSDVSFDTGNCNFDGEYPSLTWNAVNDPLNKLDGVELRYGASWAAGTKIDFVKKGTTYLWRKYPLATGRTVTVWIAAKDIYGNYSAIPDSIELTNAAPSMSGFSPTVTIDKKSKTALVDWSEWAGLTATDLRGFRVYRSTEATCTINATNFVDEAGATKTKMTISGLTKKLTYDFRVVPVDKYSDSSEYAANASS